MSDFLSSWNYRVVKKDGKFFVAEVYYQDGKPVLIGMPQDSWLETEGPSKKDKDELKEGLKLMLKAFDKPTLSYSRIVKSKEHRSDFLSELIANRMEKDKNFDKKIQKIVTELKELDGE